MMASLSNPILSPASRVLLLLAIVGSACNSKETDSASARASNSGQAAVNSEQTAVDSAQAAVNSTPPAEHSPDQNSANTVAGGTPSADGPKSPADSTAGAVQRANRLANETSIYLKMHAHNPVDWHPWGEEALDKAKRENKLIFLSVGYSSCHWCHVMERESFMDEEIARFLNEHFVCIKVDREERPDVDTIYMTAVQLITRRGGWPMSVFLTPDGRPFFGGTYFPARDGDRPGATGFLTVVRRVQEGWQTKREDVPANEQKLTREDIQEYGRRLTDAIQAELRGQEVPTTAKLDSQMAQRTQQALASQFDSTYGGFGFSEADPARPKFPEPSNLVFSLHRFRQVDDDQQIQRMLLTTLERMSMGGIWDHLGGGFHRYSVDRYWQIPHFEKMLYDNGQLLSVYSEAYHLTQRDDFRRIVDQTVRFLMREMRDSGGAFFAAIDAESEHVEGKSYRWTQEEVKTALGEDYELFASVYGLDGAPNFEDHYYVLQLSRPLAEIAAEKGMSPGELEAELSVMRQRLLAVRNQRVQPITDTKILSSWNGLVIRGLADAGRFLEQPDFTDAAAQAARFVLANLRNDQGRLLRTYSEGGAKLNAYLDDYAFVVDGLIALHQATGDPTWLNQAQELTQLQIDLFWDEQAGGFFFTSKDHESLIARVKRSGDSALPSGNSVSAANLLYLAQQLADEPYRQRARETVLSMMDALDQYPSIAPRASVVIDKLTDQTGGDNQAKDDAGDNPVEEKAANDDAADDNAANDDAANDDAAGDDASEEHGS